MSLREAIVARLIQAEAGCTHLEDHTHCVHGVFVGDPYGPDHLCHRCEMDAPGPPAHDCGQCIRETMEAAWRLNLGAVDGKLVVA